MGGTWSRARCMARPAGVGNSRCVKLPGPALTTPPRGPGALWPQQRPLHGEDFWLGDRAFHSDGDGAGASVL